VEKTKVDGGRMVKGFVSVGESSLNGL